MAASMVLLRFKNQNNGKTMESLIPVSLSRNKKPNRINVALNDLCQSSRNLLLQ